MPYLDLETASRRLRQSVVMHDNEPVWVEDVELVQDPVQDPLRLVPGYVEEGRPEIPDPDLPYRDQTEAVRRNLRNWSGLGAERIGREYVVAWHQEVINMYRGGRRPARNQVLEPDQIQLIVKNVAVGGRAFRVNQMDPLLCLRPVPLGMVNYAPDKCGFLERQPVRRYAQGLRHENSAFWDLFENRERGGRGQGGYPFELNRSAELVNTIKGQYPTVQEALANLAGSNEPNPCQAFQRNLALSLDPDLGLLFLHYRRRKIAHSDNGDVFKVAPAFTFMRETLERNGVEARYAA